MDRKAQKTKFVTIEGVAYWSNDDDDGNMLLSLFILGRVCKL
jgi:hypothetical protein